MDAPPSSSKDTTAVDRKLNEEQTDNDKVQKKFVLPPEYDEHDSRWTLKYREPAPGLVELMEHSGVYVNADKLAECEKLSNDCETFGRMLLTEIFNTTALSTCSWTSETTKASDIHGGQARPALDENAKHILLMYVKQFGVFQNWNITDYQRCLNSMRQIMLELRRDRQKEENYFNELMEKFSLTHFRQILLEMIRSVQKEEEDICDKVLAEGSQTRKCFLPPEYNENDSRWTLKYPEPASGLVELMPQSGVFVNADKLALSVLFSKDCVTLARKLLDEIFTTNALCTCSWTDPIAEDSNHGGTNTRPRLNENAMKTWLNFVAEFELENNWIIKTNNKYTQNILQQKLEVLKPVEKKEHISSSLANLEEASELKEPYVITDGSTCLSKYMATELPKLNENQTEPKDKQNDKRKFVLPPEYDEHDSRWTLQYREPAPGLVELVEHSGVYVNADKLARCKVRSKDCKKLAKMLLSEVFTTNALSTCALPTALCNANRIHVEHGRPELPTHATTTLLNFVAEYGLEKDWKVDDCGCILRNISRTIDEMRILERKMEHYRKRPCWQIAINYDKMVVPASPSNDTSTETPKLNEEQTKQSDKRKFVLPPEYDETDSRWTLNYRGPAPGLVELVENSSVYFNAAKLAECKTVSTDCHKLSTMLLLEVFTKNALRTCALPTALCKAFGVIKEHDISELALHATEALLTFIAECGPEKDWKVDDYGCILKEIRRNNEMRWYGRKRKIVLPPKYDANDSRWTLKYRGPAPGLVELVENSSVYVNAAKLAECETFSKDCVTLARRLVNEIFTTSALSACSVTNVIASDLESDITNLRPRLDEHAMGILLKFVTEYGLAKDWKIMDHQFIQNCIRQKMEVTKYVEWNEKKGGHARNDELYLRWTKRDSIWTLVHRIPSQREVELMEHSGVYVDEDKLIECKKLSNDCGTLALTLLTEVFKMSALRECSLSEKNRRIYESWPAPNTRPYPQESCELDAHAEIILLNFVDEYGLKMKWPLLDFRFIREGMLRKIQEIQQEARAHFRFLRNLTDRWTIQYHEPAPGLVVLMEHSGVYVDCDKLARYKNTDSIEIIVSRLLYEVFTMYALRTCTLPAVLYNDIGIRVEPDRPELDLNATTTLLEFVEECREKQGRKRLDKRFVLALIHCRLEKERRWGYKR